MLRCKCIELVSVQLAEILTVLECDCSWLSKIKVEHHCPLQIELYDCRQFTEPVSGQSRTPTKTTSPLLPFLPPSLPPPLHA